MDWTGVGVWNWARVRATDAAGERVRDANWRTGLRDDAVDSIDDSLAGEDAVEDTADDGDDGADFLDFGTFNSFFCSSASTPLDSDSDSDSNSNCDSG